MNHFPTTVTEYAQAREKLLARIVRGLEQDERIGAAWLLGSYGRGEQDEVSDIDLCVVVLNPYTGSLCSYDLEKTSGAPASRLALFRQFGEPVNIHDNHANAPKGGAFSAVLYRDPPVAVDWTLVPATFAWQEEQTRLLFDRIGVSRVPPAVEVIAHARENSHPNPLEERVAFFWMMAAVAAKYIVRGDPPDVQWVLPFLEQVVKQIETLDGSKPCGNEEPVSLSQEEQSARLRELYSRVASRGRKNTAPREQIEAILCLEKK